MKTNEMINLIKQTIQNQIELASIFIEEQYASLHTKDDVQRLLTDLVQSLNAKMDAIEIPDPAPVVPDPAIYLTYDQLEFAVNQLDVDECIKIVDPSFKIRNGNEIHIEYSSLDLDGDNMFDQMQHSIARKIVADNNKQNNQTNNNG